MKRFLVFMCMVLCVFTVYSALQDTKNVTLAVVVPQVYELKISDVDATTVSGFNTADVVSDVVFEYGEYDSDIMYALIKTNDPGAVFVALTLVNLKSVGITDEIGYEMWVDDALLGTSDTAGVVKTMVTADVFAGHGLRVVSVPFYVRLVDDDVWNAMVATYTANIAFTLQSP